MTITDENNNMTRQVWEAYDDPDAGVLVRVDLPDANPGLLIARGRDDHFKYWPDGKLKSRTDASVVTTT